MFARAAREPRVIAGVLLTLAAVLLGYLEYRHVRAQADRDYAYCASPTAPSGCTAERKPLEVITSRGSSDGFKEHYSLAVQTGERTTLTIGVSAETAAHFEGQSSAEVRYRNGHESAIVADDGSSIEVPFIFNVDVAAIGGVAVALLMLGGGFLAWGFTGVNRSPRTA